MATWVTIILSDGSRLSGRLVCWNGGNSVEIDRQGRRYVGTLERGMAVVR